VGSLIILVAMFALLWVLLIRPQRKRQQEQQSMLSSVDVGDEVLTVGGLYGIVREIDEDDDLIVEIAEGIQVRIARRAVGGVVKPEDEAADEDEAAGEEDGGSEVTVEDAETVDVAEESGEPMPNEVDVVNREESVSEGEARPA
jgi:preprotein translocase subunit YajC